MVEPVEFNFNTSAFSSELLQIITIFLMPDSKMNFFIAMGI
jgi:hypothetical protein